MKITESHKQTASELKSMLLQQEPEVLYCLADFMEFDGLSMEGITSPNIEEAICNAKNCDEIYSSNGEPQTHMLDLGIYLKSIAITVFFEKDFNGNYDVKDYEIISNKTHPQKFDQADDALDLITNKQEN